MIQSGARCLLAVLALWGVLGPATAGAACVEPRVPACVSNLTESASRRSLQSCKKELQKFMSEVDPWLECKRIEKEANAAAAIERFNCIVKAEGSCD